MEHLHLLRSIIRHGHGSDSFSSFRFRNINMAKAILLSDNGVQGGIYSKNYPFNIMKLISTNQVQPAFQLLTKYVHM